MCCLQVESIADCVKAAAEAALASTNFVFDSETGMYYDCTSGYYYNAVSLSVFKLELLQAKSIILLTTGFILCVYCT